MNNIIEYFRKINGDKYIYDDDFISIDHKIKIFCKSCKNYFIQNIYKHKNGQNCPNCSGGVRKSKDDFIKKSIDKFGDKNCDYSLVDYIINKHRKYIK